MSLEGSVGGKCSRRACCFSCRREGANLRKQGMHSEPALARALPESSREGSGKRRTSLPVETPPTRQKPLPSRGAPLHSRVVADADNGPHQEPRLCPAPPPPACGHRWAPWPCLLWALAIQDTQENVNGSLGGTWRWQ